MPKIKTLGRQERHFVIINNMEKKDLFKQRLEINARYRQRIRKQQLKNAIEIVGAISTIMIFGLLIAVWIIWIFNL